MGRGKDQSNVNKVYSMIAISNGPALGFITGLLKQWFPGWLVEATEYRNRPPPFEYAIISIDFCT